MVIDGDGECVTARRDRRLLRVAAQEVSGGLLLHDLESGQELTVRPATGPEIPVTVHGRGAGGIHLGSDADAWFADLLGRDDVRLVSVGSPRPLNPDHSRPGDATAFADAYPISLATTRSLAQLGDWITETALERGEDPAMIPMERFRPNLVVDGDSEAFAEDRWRTVQIGDVTFDVAKRIDRCVLTTIDPQTLQSGPEPIRTLARHRREDGKTWFAVQLIPRSRGPVRVGDDVVPAAID